MTRMDDTAEGMEQIAAQLYAECRALDEDAPVDPAHLETAFDAIMAGDVPSEAIAAILLGLRARGESPDDVGAVVRALRRASAVDAVPLQLAVLAELAVLRLRQEDPAAADLARLVLAHPAAGGVSRAHLEGFSDVSMPGDGIGFHTAALHTAVTALLSAVDPAAIAAEI